MMVVQPPFDILPCMVFDYLTIPTSKHLNANSGLTPIYTVATSVEVKHLFSSSSTKGCITLPYIPPQPFVVTIHLCIVVSLAVVQAQPHQG